MRRVAEARRDARDNPPRDRAARRSVPLLEHRELDEIDEKDESYPNHRGNDMDEAKQDRDEATRINCSYEYPHRERKSREGESGEEGPNRMIK